MEGSDVAQIETPAARPPAGAAAAHWLIRRLPADLLGRLGERDMAAIAAAASGGWATHPVDIRISLPWLSRRYYITIVSGPERRPAQRRATDRRPLATAGNILFAIGLTSALFMAGAIAALFLARIVEY